MSLTIEPTYYRIERSTSISGPWTAIAVVAHYPRHYVDTGLANGVAYFYRIVGVQGRVESEPSAVFQAITQEGTLDHIVVTPAADTIGDGLTQQYTAMGHYVDLSEIDITGLVTWATSNSNIATISASGLLTAVRNGSCNVTAVRAGKTGTTTVTVATTLSSITVTPAGIDFDVAATQQFTATGNYHDGTTADLTALATWASTNTGVATIDATGLATGVAGGVTTITATYGGKTGSAGTAVNKTLVSLAVTPSSVSLADGTTQQFTVVGTYDDATTADLTTQVTWTSDDPAVLSIGASTGLGTALVHGTCTVTATMGAITDTSSVTVTTVISAIIVTPATFTIAWDATKQFTATARYHDGTSEDITATSTWASSSPTIATVGAATGLADGVKHGATNITATKGGVTGTAVLTVTSTIDSLSFSPISATFTAAGQSSSITVYGNYADGSTEVIPWTECTFTSDRPDKGTVSLVGSVTSVAPGTTTYIITVDVAATTYHGTATGVWRYTCDWWNTVSLYATTAADLVGGWTNINNTLGSPDGTYGEKYYLIPPPGGPSSAQLIRHGFDVSGIPSDATINQLWFGFYGQARASAVLSRAELQQGIEGAAWPAGTVYFGSALTKNQDPRSWETLCPVSVTRTQLDHITTRTDKYTQNYGEAWFDIYYSWLRLEYRVP